VRRAESGRERREERIEEGGCEYVENAEQRRK
jgi:hypothetical protein